MGYLPKNIVVGFCSIALLFCDSEVYGMETAASSGNFRNPYAVQRVLSGKEPAANAAWWGFHPTDSTQAIQNAINSGAPTVIIPYMGRDWVVQPIKLASNQNIIFEPGVVVIAKEGVFKGTFEQLFSASALSNITLQGYGAALRMRKDDYKSSRYTKSEHRHAVQFLGCNNISIIGLRLESSGGDGIYLGSTRDERRLPCKNVLIKDCICDNNYRQGISVTSVNKLRVENCVLSNTSGTMPASGIDLEPDNSAGMLVNVVIRDCIATDNGGSGFIASISNLNANSQDVSVLFVNCYAKNCGDPGLRVRAVNQGRRPRGLIEFRNCTSENTSYPGLFVHWEKTDSPIKLRFSNCNLRDVGTRHNQHPIGLTLRRKRAAIQTGQIEFHNCYVYDSKNRPFLKITDVGGGEGIYDVKGNINVCNPYGAKMNLGTTSEKLALKVKSFTLQE